MNKLKGLVLIFFVACMEGLVIYLIKSFNKTKNIYYYIGSLLIYAIMLYLISLSYSYLTLGMSQLLMSGLVMMFGLLLGTFMFGENMTKQEWMGIGIIIVGIVITQL